MNDVVKFYQEIADQKRSNCPQIADIQAKGLAYLLKNGFPTRHDEDWRYSAPIGFVQERFSPASFFSQGGDGQGEGEAIFIRNGQRSQPSILPSGIQIMGLAEAFENHPKLLSRYQQALFPIEHGFHALNAALLDTSWVIYVPARLKLDLPLACTYIQDQMNQSVHARCVVVLEEGASLNLIEEFTGAQDCVYLSSRILEVFLEPNAHLTHTLIQQESQQAYHLSHVFAHQAQSSTFQSHVINLGGKWVRSDQSLYLQGQHASCLLNGIYGLTHAQQMDHHTAVFHESGGCESQQDYKGIIAGKSRAVFNGRVVVAPHAQQTRAIQQNKNLLLSQEAEVNTKPQLEIEANDVACSHGATVGQLDEEALFYFASRGVSREAAMRFMIAGFASKNIGLIGQPALQEALSSRLYQHLLGEKHGHAV